MRRVFLPLRLGIYLATFCFLGPPLRFVVCFVFVKPFCSLVSFYFSVVLGVRRRWQRYGRCCHQPKIKNVLFLYYYFCLLYYGQFPVAFGAHAGCCIDNSWVWMIFLAFGSLVCGCVHFFFAGKANKFWNRNPEQDFRHLLVIFLPGTFNKYPLLSQRSIFGLFERNLVVLADFAHSKFLTDGYSPSFDFITRFWLEKKWNLAVCFVFFTRFRLKKNETGPVGLSWPSVGISSLCLAPNGARIQVPVSGCRPISCRELSS